MVLRAVWIISRATGALLFSRRFPNAELRHKTECEARGIAYSVLPPDEEWQRQFVTAKTPSANVNNSFFRLIHSVGDLWPVLSISKDLYWIIALPSVLVSQEDRKDIQLLNIYEITAGFTALDDIVSYLSHTSDHDKKETMEQKILELGVLLSLNMPFGNQIDETLLLTKSMYKNGFLQEKPLLTQKQPASQPYNYKGSKQALSLCIREEFSAVQYDVDTTPDVWNVNGVVLCKAELEGVPDINITMSSEMISGVSYHPCVQAADTHAIRKIYFSPPSYVIPLCHYHVENVPSLPLRGFFQMKEIDEVSVKILVQLKLSENVTNNFDYCFLTLPFTNRGVITHLELSPTAGTIAISQNRQTLIWNLGQKFSGRNREVALPGTIYFSSAQTPVKPGDKQLGIGGMEAGTDSFTRPILESLSGPLNENSDPLCIGATSYVRLQFKFPDVSVSSLTIDPKSFQTYPVNPKAKLIVTKELVAADYIIWNSLGSSRVALPPSIHGKLPPIPVSL